MAEENNDLTPFHRQMAAACNNRAWDLWEQDEMSSDEKDDMLHAAHAAYLHWDRVGKPVNRLRAWVTLAYAHIRGGSHTLAERYIRSAENLLKDDLEGIADWDESFLLDARSRLHEIRDELAPAEEYRRQAKESGEKIAEEGDREFFLSTLKRHRIRAAEKP